MYKFYLSCLILAFFSLSSCEKEAIDSGMSFEMQIPEGFPEMTVPAENQFTLDRWLLGKKLFYDPLLSRDSSISCASCHKPGLAFSDEIARSLGVANAEGTRNSSTLTNIGYHPYYTREGGVPTLEMQALVPIQEHDEMDFNVVAAGERIREIPAYVALSKKAYDMEPDYYVVTRALACFERSLISGNSPYDQYTYQGDKSALGSSEIRGKELFFSEQTKCSSCHGGFNFTNYAFENNGLYEVYADRGRFRVTGDLEDEEKFKVPSLRNIEVTGPYMHDGSINTLEEVIEHYNSGGAINENKHAFIQALGLSQGEKEDLINFLKSLTDETFIQNKFLKP